MAITTLAPIHDGVVGRRIVDESFGTIRAGVGNYVDDVSGTIIATSLTDSGTINQFYDIRRGIFVFDLSSIPSDHIVTAAQLRIVIVSKADQLAQNVGLTQASPASDSSFVMSDYDIIHFGGTRLATDKSITSWDGSLDFNADGFAYLNGVIASAGHARIGLRVSSDIDNSPPSIWSSFYWSYVQIFSSKSGGVSIVITHQPGVGGSPLFIFT